jgi:hypothetical protein
MVVVMENLQELILLCKSSVTIWINDHRDYYLGIEEYLTQEGDIEFIQPIVLQEMLKRDLVIRIQCYPLTPNGFFVVYHYDMNEAIKIAIINAKNY